VSSTTSTRLLGIPLLWAVVVTSCGDQAQTPVVEGSPPEFLAGVWEVEDSSFECFSWWSQRREGAFTDTICIGGPDFATLNAQAAWDMYLDYEDILPGRWTAPSFKSCSGIISDTLIQVYCVARVSATLEECDFTVRFYTSATPDADHWKLLRRVVRIEGEDCGHRRDDSTVYCHTYITSLSRIGDTPETCEHGDSSAIGP